MLLATAGFYLERFTLGMLPNVYVGHFDHIEAAPFKIALQ